MRVAIDDSHTRIYAEGDPDMPEEFRDLLVRMLTHHLENTTNPRYIELLNSLWAKGMMLPIDTYCDLAYFNALGDRVGCYIGETWDGVPYEPLLSVADRLHKDEVFHATFGMNNLRRICHTLKGLEEANEKIKIWWPAALDMFGRSDSSFSDAYVKWGLRRHNNEELRQHYIADTRPMLEKLGIEVPDDTATRKFL
jgi:ring-1,2-phenylacetyl-CoA epoxidase subunit PaaA